MLAGDITWTPVARRLGFSSALGVTVIGAAYVMTGVAWMVSREAGSPGPLEPGEPYRAVLEFLICAVGAHAGGGGRGRACVRPAWREGGCGGGARAHGRICGADRRHALRATRRRPTPSGRSGAGELHPARLSLTFDCARDRLPGLGSLPGIGAPAHGPVFAGGRLQTAVRGAIMLSGALCAAGFLGPLPGNMRLQMLAIGGYAFGLPVACALLAILFRQSPPAGAGGTAS